MKGGKGRKEIRNKMRRKEVQEWKYERLRKRMERHFKGMATLR